MEQDRPYPPHGGRKPGEPLLAQYRLYFREGSDGHFSLCHEFEAQDDAQAVNIAQAWLEGRRAELWCGVRRLKTWPGETP